MNYNFVKVNNELARLSYSVAGVSAMKQIGPLDGFGFMAAFSAVPAAWNGGTWLWQNRGNYQSAWQALKANGVAQNALNQSMKGNNIFQTAMNLDRMNRINGLGAKYSMPQPLSAGASAAERAKFIRNSRKMAYFDDVRTAVNNAKGLKGVDQAKALAEIEQKVAEAKLNVHNAKINGNLKPTTTTGKIIAGAKKYTGVTYLSGKTKSWAVKSPIFRKIASGVKGNALFAGISLACEAPEIIETYKTLGTSKGNKQLLKSTAVVAAETAGFWAGAKVGGIAGAKLGALLGTVVPGIGNAVGAIVGGLVGMACGMVVGHFAGKGMKAIVGKSELEKHRQAQGEAIIKQLKNSDKDKVEFMGIAKEHIDTLAKNGRDTLPLEQSFGTVAADLKNRLGLNLKG